jgi:hypothetical protein
MKKIYKPLHCISILFVVAIGIISIMASGGGGGSNSDNGGGNTTTGDYVVLAWNDLGMHCLNPTYDKLVILPPYNTQWVQVIKRGNPPQIVTANIQVDYSILNNTSSHDKPIDKPYYGQFWDNAFVLFGVNLQTDYGLNLRPSGISHTLSGSYELVGDHFQADGIPVVPLEDGATTKNPYQVAVVTVKDLNGNTLATTRATVPTSDDINCAKCHGTGTVDSAFDNIAILHDEATARDGNPNNNTNLSTQKPRLCAECHGSPVLGLDPVSPRGSSGKYLSEAIHGFHADKSGITCYSCHPGETAKCNRSEKHMGSTTDGNCTTCHGDLANVASSQSESLTEPRVPWVNEPTCATSTCHYTDVKEVATGSTLYRNATGHGGLYCAGCHQSPHAMVPSVEASDNYQALQYQAKDISIGSCRNCHSTSAGGGSIDEFAETHGGSNPEDSSACNVCHTGLPSSISATEFPHQFSWKKTRS